MNRGNDMEDFDETIMMVGCATILVIAFLLTLAFRFGVLFAVFKYLIGVEMNQFTKGSLGALSLISNIEWWYKNLRRA